MARILYHVGQLMRETGQALDRLGLTLQGSNAFREQLTRHRTIQNLIEKVPKVPASAFVAPSASVIGNVTIGENSSVWYGCVLRGDVNEIVVGANTNIQDGTIIHVAKSNLGGRVLPTIIGDKVTIGHRAVIHACTIEDEALVGMGAVVMDGAVVQKGAIVAAGANVTPGTTVPSGVIFAGNPAKFLRNLVPEENEFIAQSAINYCELAATHLEETSKSFEQIMSDKEWRDENEQTGEEWFAHMGIQREPRPQVDSKTPSTA